MIEWLNKRAHNNEILVILNSIEHTFTRVNDGAKTESRSEERRKRFESFSVLRRVDHRARHEVECDGHGCTNIFGHVSGNTQVGETNTCGVVPEALPCGHRLIIIGNAHITAAWSL